MGWCDEGSLFLYHMITLFLGGIMYIVAFSEEFWIRDDYFDYGLWQKCNSTHYDCDFLPVAASDGYFEAARTLSCFALIGMCLALLSTFWTESSVDRGAKKKCFKYGHGLLVCTSVALAVTVMALVGSGYKDDDTFSQPTLGWCFWVCLTSCILACISVLSRCCFIAKRGGFDGACDCCTRKSRKTHPAKINLNIRKKKANNAGKKLTAIVKKDQSARGKPEGDQRGELSGDAEAEVTGLEIRMNTLIEDKLRGQDSKEPSEAETKKEKESTSLPVARYDLPDLPADDNTHFPPSSYHAPISRNPLADVAPPAVARPQDTTRTAAFWAMVHKWMPKRKQSKVKDPERAEDSHERGSEEARAGTQQGSEQGHLRRNVRTLSPIRQTRVVNV